MTATVTATGSTQALRHVLAKQLVDPGHCSVEVDSEFQWKGVRRLARTVARNRELRVHSHLAPPTGDAAWPRTLWLWNPDIEVTERELRRAALAMNAFFEPS